MADEPEDTRTLKEKLLFYTTAFFILLGTFSLFAFLFLVPFVIDPAFTTIFMQFDINPALCVTSEIDNLRGVKNCSWTSCKEGCTKDVYECTQIRVNYKIHSSKLLNDSQSLLIDDELPSSISIDKTKPVTKNQQRMERAIRDYDYLENSLSDNVEIGKVTDDLNTPIEYTDIMQPSSGLQGNNSEWYFIGARLFPNVKGCGYPPMLNCTIWMKKYIKLGTNFSCFYSKVDPSLVISDLDMHQNLLNLIYAMAIPIPSFIISIIYLTFAYFKIYKEDEESALLDKNDDEVDIDDDVDQIDRENCDDEDDDEFHNDCDDDIDTDKRNDNETLSDINQSSQQLPNGNGSIQGLNNGPITPNSDLASFGHQLKVKMVDEMSRDSIDVGLSNSGSIQG